MAIHDDRIGTLNAARRAFEEKKALDQQTIEHEETLLLRKARMIEQKLAINRTMNTQERVLTIYEEILFGNASDEIKKEALTSYTEIAGKIIENEFQSRLETEKLNFEKEKVFHPNSIERWKEYNKHMLEAKKLDMQNKAANQD